MELVYKNGDIITLKTTTLYVPKIQCCFFIPQSYIKDYNDNSKLVMYNYNEMIFQFSKNKQVVVPNDMTT